MQHISHNAAYGKHRIQTAHGILENHGNLAAADLTLHPPLLKLKQICSVQQDLAGLDAARRTAQQLLYGKCKHCFALTGLADQTIGLALLNSKMLDI